MFKNYAALYVATIAFSLFSCCGDQKLPDQNRSYINEVRSDCESWLKAFVRDKEKIVFISKITGGVSELSKLELLLKSNNITAPASALRYKRIAERMGVPPMSEPDVIMNIISVAGEISK